MVFLVFIVADEQIPYVGIDITISLRTQLTINELVEGAVLDIDVEVVRTTVEDGILIALKLHGGCFIIFVVHQRSCRCVGIDIERLQCRHILEGVVGYAICQFLMDGHRRE